MTKSMSNLIDRQVMIDDLHGKDPSQIWDTADIEVWVNDDADDEDEIFIGYLRKKMGGE